MILKGSEIAALAFSSLSLVALGVGMTAAIMTGEDRDTERAAKAVANEEQRSSGNLRYELWDAFQACKNKMGENESYKVANSFMDSHSSRYNKKTNMNEIYMSADVYFVEKSGVNRVLSTVTINCEVSAKDNEVAKFKSKIQRG